jgi:hypothetical protein
MDYSVKVLRTPVRESRQVLFQLTFRREWMFERELWRDILVSQKREFGDDCIGLGADRVISLNAAIARRRISKSAER